ncbi:hypothetical protein VC83_00608 [Pseudogymnoascus destructans]|uniref:Uncharacterized protein n=1 Tax=Pseudogymnoascus destructans TaxID=655981 RepID=A0A177ALC8_9PEZI|nr:uncharacterized protein VC83_00608 [Pseudogymnoascus destructans]OAF62866.1 hypothetical protein VC83_00608 [Pseudogymnoascus destructans]
MVRRIFANNPIYLGETHKPPPSPTSTSTSKPTSPLSTRQPVTVLARPRRPSSPWPYYSTARRTPVRPRLHSNLQPSENNRARHATPQPRRQSSTSTSTTNHHQPTPKWRPHRPPFPPHPHHHRIRPLPASPPRLSPRIPPPRPHSPARSPSPLSDHPPAPRRRSSLISLISIDSLSSLSSARRTLHSDSASLLHPPPVDAHDGLSAWHSLPLAFALLPALGGLMFKDGSRFVSDVLLLGLAAVFLNWSVRLPWDWYRSAQEIRTTTSPSPPPQNQILPAPPNTPAK